MKTVQIKELVDYSEEDLKKFLEMYDKMIKSNEDSIRYWEDQKQKVEEALQKKLLDNK